MARSSTRLLGKHAVAEGTMAFRFEKPAGFAFKPGQAIDLFLPVEPGHSESQSHAFSIVAAPQESELVIATRMRVAMTNSDSCGAATMEKACDCDSEWPGSTGRNRSIAWPGLNAKPAGFSKRNAMVPSATACLPSRRVDDLAIVNLLCHALDDTSTWTVPAIGMRPSCTQAGCRCRIARDRRDSLK